MTIFRDRLTIVLLAVNFFSYFVNPIFFYGMTLFFINYLSFKVIVGNIFNKTNEGNIANIKRFLFIPAFVIKLGAIGVLSYYVLIVLAGNPFWYVGGFGAGLAIFAIGSLAERRKVSHEAGTGSEES